MSLNHRLAYRLRFAALGAVLLGTVAIGVALWSNAHAQDEVPNPVPNIAFSSSSYTVGEADGTVTLTVTLSNSYTSTVTVDYASSDGTASGSTNGGEDGGDYAVTSGTLTFSPGQTSKPIVINLYNDFCCESSETFSVTLSNPSNGTLGSPSATTVTITDNDSGCE